jgi:uncharacterized membrane protein YqjE
MQDLRILPEGGGALEDDDGKPPRFLLSFILSIDVLLSLLSLFVVVVVVVVVVAKTYSLNSLLLARDDRFATRV